MCFGGQEMADDLYFKDTGAELRDKHISSSMLSGNSTVIPVSIVYTSTQLKGTPELHIIHPRPINPVKTQSPSPGA